MPQHEAYNREQAVGCLLFSMLYVCIFIYLYVCLDVWYSQRQSMEFTKVYFKNGDKNLVIYIVDIVYYTTGSGYREVLDRRGL